MAVEESDTQSSYLVTRTTVIRIKAHSSASARVIADALIKVNPNDRRTTTNITVEKVRN